MVTTIATQDLHALDNSAAWSSLPPPSVAGHLAPRTAYDVLRFEPRQTVVSQGEPARHVFEILDGAVMLVATLPDGRRQILEILGPGRLVGIPLTATHRTSVITTRATRLRRYDRDEVERSEVLQERAGKELRQRFSSLQDMVLLLGCKTAAERVASLILDMAGRPQHRSKATDRACPVEIELDFGQSEIASYLGLTLETVCREFTKLKRSGVIAARGRTRIAILDPARLSAAAEEVRPPRQATPRKRHAAASADRPRLEAAE